MLAISVVGSCLAEIQRIWQETPETRRPWGVWIAHHELIQKDADRTDTAVISAWFLSDKGIEKRNVWAYVRFRLIQSGKYWYSGILPPEPSPVFGGVRQMYEIGFASFASIEREPLVYLDYIWGGLYGAGSLYRIEHSGSITFDSQVWIS